MKPLNTTGILYAFPIFIGAFLLFQVQPLMGKFILPWFGGSADVWTACMVFFQVLLLGGYLYAHLSRLLLPPKMQRILHLLLLAGAVAALPILPAASSRPQTIDHPSLQILLLLARSVGLPFFVLASTGPLLQHWFSRSHPDASPYWLYALSNAASLLALISYPFVFEPLLSRAAIAWIWSVILIGFAVFCGICAITSLRRDGSNPSLGFHNPESAGGDCPLSIAALPCWIALPAVASVELLAVTAKITQDIAPVPFLWILPLMLYLLSFILCFQSERLYFRPLWVSLFLLGLIAMGGAKYYSSRISDLAQIGVYLTALFACCMVCHGELYRLRPPPVKLTHYYLMIAAGGALGGIFVGGIAPRIFNTYLELPLGMLACCLLVFWLDKRPAFSRRPWRRWFWIAAISLAGCAAILLENSPAPGRGIPVLQRRNFFGVLTLWERNPNDPDRRHWLIQHGTTFHGMQFTDPQKQRWPTAYYGPQSGAGLALKCLPKQSHRRIGVVGLGAGTLAAYAKPHDLLCFYEINPAVQELAQTRFSYLSQCPGEVQIVMGDARLSLERQAPQQYDILLLDAFSSDAIPVHLLTVEAFETYLRHLRPDGVLAFHVSNMNLDLPRVVQRIARHVRMPSLFIHSAGSSKQGTLSSKWILLSRNREFLDRKELLDAAEPDGDRIPPTDLWTDDHINLLQIFHFRSN